MKDNKLIFFLFTATFQIVNLKAQVTIDKYLKLTDTINQNRQIRGIGDPSDSSDAVNQKTFQFGTLLYGSATGTDTISVNLNPPVNSYTTGMLFSFKATNNNTGPVMLKINNLNEVPVQTPDTENLFANYIRAGQMVTLIYRNNSFQVAGRTDPGCPAGFVEANDKYCIETKERTGTTYANAVSICDNLNARLCNWSEWYYACQKTSLGLVNKINNWEYIDDTSDHAHTVTVVGYQGCNQSMGLGTIGLATPYSYRCCFSK